MRLTQVYLENPDPPTPRSPPGDAPLGPHPGSRPPLPGRPPKLPRALGRGTPLHGPMGLRPARGLRPFGSSRRSPPDFDGDPGVAPGRPLWPPSWLIPTSSSTPTTGASPPRRPAPGRSSTTWPDDAGAGSAPRS